MKTKFILFLSVILYFSLASLAQQKNTKVECNFYDSVPTKENKPDTIFFWLKKYRAFKLHKEEVLKKFAKQKNISIDSIGYVVQFILDGCKEKLLLPCMDNSLFAFDAISKDTTDLYKMRCIVFNETFMYNKEKRHIIIIDKITKD